MSLIEKIKKDKITAMKARDSVAKSILVVVQSDVESASKTSGKEITDEDVIRVAKKLFGKNVEAIQIGESSGRDVTKLVTENEILSEFIPSVLDVTATKAAVDAEISKLSDDQRNKKSMGNVMGALKAKFASKLDMSLAQPMVAKALN
jgi:uncharacterized protein